MCFYISYVLRTNLDIAEGVRVYFCSCSNRKLIGLLRIQSSKLNAAIRNTQNKPKILT